MKITIKIECDCIQNFQGHLLDMYEKTVIHLHEQSKTHGGVEGVDEFNPKYINNENILDDNNCYGSRTVEMSRD